MVAYGSEPNGWFAYTILYSVETHLNLNVLTNGFNTVSEYLASGSAALDVASDRIVDSHDD
jgi:hypothetical protein